MSITAYMEQAMTPSETRSILKETALGVSFRCCVQPRASQTALAGLHGDAVKISLKAPPVDGKANAELIKFLAKKLDVPKGAVNIVRGRAGRNKIVAVAGLSSAAFAKRLV